MIAKHAIVFLFAALAPIAGARAATTTVGQEGQHFDEKTLAIAAGDTVVFQNNDTVRHNIKILNDADEITDLGLQVPGQSLNFVLDKPGHYRARCGIHPSMKMTIIVK